MQEKRGREIVLKAMGQAISKAVAIAEIIKVVSITSVAIHFPKITAQSGISILGAEKVFWFISRYYNQFGQYH